jgi:hypothetical protein
MCKEATWPNDFRKKLPIRRLAQPTRWVVGEQQGSITVSEPAICISLANLDQLAYVTAQFAVEIIPC